MLFWILGSGPTLSIWTGARFKSPPDWQQLTDLLSVTKADIEEHFANHGTGTIKEVKLMNGFGFIEYEDAMDAKDVVPGQFPAICNIFLILTSLQRFV